MKKIVLIIGAVGAVFLTSIYAITQTWTSRIHHNTRRSNTGRTIVMMDCPSLACSGSGVVAES